jgi:hypothetical protein
VELNHPTDLLAGLNALRLSRQFCDVILCVDGQEFPTHRIILSSFSAYFRAMFASEMAEKSQDRVSINGVEPSMLQLIIQYAYTSEINITKSNVQSLLSASNLLQVLHNGILCISSPASSTSFFFLLLSSFCPSCR